jgi:hypothetical protein
MQVRSGHSITFLHPFFIVSSLEGIQKFLNCEGYPKKKEKEKASELSLRICLWVVVSTPIYQNCVESFLPRYCISIL